MQRALLLLWFSATSVETTLPATDVDAALREDYQEFRSLPLIIREQNTGSQPLDKSRSGVRQGELPRCCGRSLVVAAQRSSQESPGRAGASAVWPDAMLLVGAARGLGDSSECLSGPQRGQAVLRLAHGCPAAMAHNMGFHDSPGDVEMFHQQFLTASVFRGVFAGYCREPRWKLSLLELLSISRPHYVYRLPMSLQARILRC